MICDSCGRADDHLHATPDGEQICTRCKLVRQRIDLIDRKGELEAEIRVLDRAIGDRPLMERVHALRLEALALNAEAVQCEEDAKEALRNKGVNPILRRRLERLRKEIGKVVIVEKVSRETLGVL